KRGCDLLENSRLDLWIVGEKNRISRTARHDAAEPPIWSLEADQIWRHREGDVAGSGLAPGIAVVQQRVRHELRQLNGMLLFPRSRLDDETQLPADDPINRGRAHAIAAENENIIRNSAEIGGIDVDQ